MQCRYPQSAHVSHLIPKTDTHSLAYVVCLCPCQCNVKWDSLQREMVINFTFLWRSKLEKKKKEEEVE